ncbi:MAG: RecX family transcriptional regulator [Bryobacteraceae bacterium]
MKTRKPALLESGALWDYAVKILAGRAHSSGELRVKLTRRAAKAGDVDDVLNRLKEFGYLNDRRFAENFASARLANEGLGQTRVLSDLARRRVAPALARQTVKDVYADTEELTLVEAFIRRKFRTVPKEALFQTEKDLASAYRRLVRAGFRSGTVIGALKKFARDPDLLDGFEPPEEVPEE